MSKPNEDPNTDGKGTATEVDSEVAVDAGQEAGSDTSADNEEGNQTDETPAEVDSPEPEPVADQPAAEPEEEELLEGDDGEKRFTQTDLNNAVKKRLAKEGSKFAAKETTFEKTISELKTELDTYRLAERESVQSKLDALPDEVKVLAPAALDTADGVMAVKAWLPKVEALASKLKEAPAPAPKPGNGSDPKPKGISPTESDEDLVEAAKKHSIYQSF